MSEIIELTAMVPAELDGKRLDQIAAALFPDYSRSRLKQWALEGDLRVDQKVHKPKDKISQGAVIRVSAKLTEEVAWQAANIALDVVYEDDSILVVNKPAGLVVHPAAGHATDTLSNALLNRGPEYVTLPRAGIVHRLDKDTSGLMVVAKTLPAHTSLVAQLQNRSVKREYEAIVTGVLTSGGKVSAAIGRHPHQRQKMAVIDRGGDEQGRSSGASAGRAGAADEQGRSSGASAGRAGAADEQGRSSAARAGRSGAAKEAVTHYRVLSRFAGHTHIRLILETGRTHQIRVHMAHIGYPLVGDPVYGGRMKLPKGASQFLRDRLTAFGRQALHARKLGLVHPASGAIMEWEIPLPQDMQDLLAVIRGTDLNLSPST